MSARNPLPGTLDRETYWEWVAAALFLLLPVDLVTTLSAAAVVGAGAEANPWMAWLLGQPFLTIVAVHIAAALAAVAGFLVYEALSRWSPHGAVMIRAARAYLFVLVCAGFAVFCNNLSVIVFRRSLIAFLAASVASGVHVLA